MIVVFSRHSDVLLLDFQVKSVSWEEVMFSVVSTPRPDSTSSGQRKSLYKTHRCPQPDKRTFPVEFLHFFFPSLSVRVNPWVSAQTFTSFSSVSRWNCSSRQNMEHILGVLHLWVMLVTAETGRSVPPNFQFHPMKLPQGIADVWWLISQRSSTDL